MTVSSSPNADATDSEGWRIPPRKGEVVRNWGGNPSLTWTPLLTFVPTTVDEVRRAVDIARRDRRRLKPLGARHSYSGVLTATGDDYALDLSSLKGILREPADGAVTLGPGGSIKEAIGLLAARGLAFANLGTHAEQTVAGSMSTNTHGTGQAFTGLSGMVRAVDFIDGQGRYFEGVSRTHHGELFDALRCSIGAVGVITAVTFEVRPQFNIAFERTVERLSPFFEQKRLDAEINGSDYFELYVLPYTRYAVVLRKRTTEDSISPGRSDDATGLRRLWRAIGDRFRHFIVNDLYRWLVGVMVWMPGLADEIFMLQRWVLSFTQDKYVDRSDRALLAEYERNPWQHLWEVELFFPVEHLSECVQTVCGVLERGKKERAFITEFPIHVRTVRGDDSYLSPTYCAQNERVYGVISVPQNPVNDAEDLFIALTDALDAVMAKHGERPVTLHWGKNRYSGLRRLEERYPAIGMFRKVRNELDPDGVFLTDWTRGALQIDGAASDPTTS